MREVPILFSAQNVRGILADIKTQTRRALNPQPFLVNGVWWALQRGEEYHFDDLVNDRAGRSPIRWAPDDRLWCRETWAPGDAEGEVYYRATAWEDTGYTDEEIAQIRWKPSIHMPRALSRITLEVEAVRIERLQDISEADAIAEGAFKGKATGRVFNNVTEMRPGGPVWRNARDWYADLWNTINGPSAWDASPWVSVTTFRRVAGG